MGGGPAGFELFALILSGRRSACGAGAGRCVKKPGINCLSRVNAVFARQGAGTLAKVIVRRSY